MSMVKWYVSCMLGPRLYYLYLEELTEYLPNRTESWSDRPIRIVSRFWIFFLILVPLVSILVPLGGFLVPVSLLTLAILFLLRGVGRYRNVVYRNFISELELDKEECQKQRKYESTKKYDFDVTVLPPLFHQNESKLVPDTPELTTLMFDRCLASILSCFVYPASVRFDLYRSCKPLAENRYELISAANGVRFRFECRSRQVIDCIYAYTTHGTNTLVVLSKGNYSFYESRGIAQWLLKGYAVVGWNHCGCGYSSGSPTGRQEKEAILTLVSYSVQVLGYPLERIFMHGNSIGGFTASYAVAAFPNIGGILLEATFDDICCLVPALVPSYFPRRLVQCFLRYCYDLNTIRYLRGYRGPVTLVRKTDDILMRSKADEIGSNRANFILIELIQLRYGMVFRNADSLQGVRKWVSADKKERLQMEMELDRNACRGYLTNCNLSQLEELSDRCKQNLGVFIATQFMKNQKALHSSNLSSKLVKIPEHIPWN